MQREDRLAGGLDRPVHRVGWDVTRLERLELGRRPVCHAIGRLQAGPLRGILARREGAGRPD